MFIKYHHEPGTGDVEIKYTAVCRQIKVGNQLTRYQTIIEALVIETGDIYAEVDKETHRTHPPINRLLDS